MEIHGCFPFGKYLMVEFPCHGVSLLDGTWYEINHNNMGDFGTDTLTLAMITCKVGHHR